MMDTTTVKTTMTTELKHIWNNQKLQWNIRNYKKILNKKSVQSNVFSDCDYKELKIKLQILKF